MQCIIENNLIDCQDGDWIRQTEDGFEIVPGTAIQVPIDATFAVATINGNLVLTVRSTSVTGMPRIERTV